MMRARVIAAAAVVGMACVCGAAQAEVFQRTALVNATGVCNGSLPSYEGALRKRPTGIANEGTSNAFVGCSMTGDETNAGSHGFFAYFVNRGAQARTINCTFVDGVAADFGIYPAQYYPQSVEVEPGAPTAMNWAPEEGEAFTALANLNCTLPPGTEINIIGYAYGEEVGVLEP